MPFVTPAEVVARRGPAGRPIRAVGAAEAKTRAGVRSISISGFLAEQLEEQLTTAVGR